MLKRLLNSLKKKPAAPAAMPAPAPAEDPRVARVRAAFATFEAQYSEFKEAARQPDASAKTLMDFAQACFELERDAECEASSIASWHWSRKTRPPIIQWPC